MKCDSQAVNVFGGAWVSEVLVQQSHHTSRALPAFYVWEKNDDVEANVTLSFSTILARFNLNMLTVFAKLGMLFFSLVLPLLSDWPNSNSKAENTQISTSQALVVLTMVHPHSEYCVAIQGIEE